MIEASETSPNLYISTGNAKSFTTIEGNAFGNNGLLFSSYADCPNGVSKYFHGGGFLKFYAKMEDNINPNNVSGTWEIKFYSEGNTNDQKRGSITSVTFDNTKKEFIIEGTETIDTVCNSKGIITIQGKCFSSSPLFYISNENERVGSTIAPSGEKVNYFLTEEVICEN